MDSKKSILILGAGIMQVPAIRTAKNKGWNVVVADADPNAVGIRYADRFEHVDLKDEEGMVRCAEKIRNEGGLDGVFTAGTDFSATVARVAETYDLPGIPYEAAVNASNKVKMRQVFARNHVPSPCFFECTKEMLLKDGAIHNNAVNSELIENITEAVPFPVVVKPVDNMGARGICRVDTRENVVEALEKAVESSRSEKAIIEEYMDGPEYSLDALIYNGTIIVTGFADRIIRFSPYFVEMGHTIPTNASEETITRITEVFFSGIRALGLNTGAAKGDMKMTEEGPMVGEIAARLSGGFMSGWTYPYSSGVDPTGAALDIAVGLPPGNLTPKWDRVASERAFISIPGTVKEVSGCEEARNLDGVEELFVRTGPGKRTVFPRNNVEKCGNVISVAPSNSVAERRSRSACAKVLVRLAPAEESTARFLFGGAEEWVPNAFELKNAENSKVYEAMEGAIRPGAHNAGGPSAPLTVCSLPFYADEESVDWNGRTIADSLEIITECGKIRLVGADNEYILGKLFWKALLRGGVQGGLWVVDTFRYCILNKIEPEDVLFL